MSLPSFSVRRHVTVFMIFLAIVVIGLISLQRMSLDLFPDIEPPMISVITYYPGAGALDVEQKVTKVMEDRLAATPDLDEMSSTSKENLSIVQLKFAWGTNLDEATNNIRTGLDFAKRFLPEDAETPMIFRLNLAMLPVLMFSVTTDTGDIQEHTDFIEDRITNIIQRVDGVASVVMFNSREKQVQAIVDRQRLEDRGISLQQLSGAMRANNLTLPAGTLDIGRTSYTLRVPGEFRTLYDIENVIVGQNKGALIYLKDVADVRFAFEDADRFARVDGRQAMMLMVQRESGANTVDVAELVQKKIKELDKQMPPGLHVATIMDMSEFILQMVDALSEAVYWGGLFVILVVFFFLRRLRSSFIVVLSIPTSLIGLFALLYAWGYTINMISLAAIAISVGMVVDNAIVVIDNIVRHLELRKTPMAAASEGASEVSGAVTASTLTTISIFAPVLFVGGMIGIMFKELAFVVIVSISISLLASLMLMPVLSQRLLRLHGNPRQRRSSAVGRRLERVMNALDAAYGRIVGWAIVNRKKVVAISVGVFGASLALIAVTSMDFMPQMDGGTVMVRTELPTGTRVEHTFEVARKIEEIIEQNVPEAQMLFVQAGESKSGMGSAMGGRQGSNIATVGCRVPKRSLRDRSTFDMVDAIRPKVETIPGIVSLEMDGANPLTQVASGGAKPLTVEVFAENINFARAAVKVVKQIVEQTPGAVDVVTDLLDDRPELHLDIDRLQAARLGIPMASISMAVRTAMYGEPVTRFRGGGDEIDVFLRLAEKDRRTEADLENLTVPSMAGTQIRLSAIADVSEGTSPVEIRRLNQQRNLRVMAAVSGRALGDVANDVEKNIEAAKNDGRLPENISTRFAGDVKEQRSMATDLTIALMLAVLLVYMVMASQFESLLDPLVIMFSVPFGITGVFLALLSTGTTLSISSFIGMIMLVGIVVKNAIVLVDYVNVMRDQGMDLSEALVTGGKRRLRPVLMTAFTTIGGMLPLALATGEGSEVWRPMGISVIGGLLVSTLVTLVLIPTVYAMTDRWRKRGRVAKAREPEPSPA